MDGVAAVGYRRPAGCQFHTESRSGTRHRMQCQHTIRDTVLPGSGRPTDHLVGGVCRHHAGHTKPFNTMGSKGYDAANDNRIGFPNGF